MKYDPCESEQCSNVTRRGCSIRGFSSSGQTRQADVPETGRRSPPNTRRTDPGAIQSIKIAFLLLLWGGLNSFGLGTNNHVTGASSFCCRTTDEILLWGGMWFFKDRMKRLASLVVRALLEAPIHELHHQTYVLSLVFETQWKQPLTAREPSRRFVLPQFLAEHVGKSDKWKRPQSPAIHDFFHLLQPRLAAHLPDLLLFT